MLSKVIENLMDVVAILTGQPHDRPHMPVEKI